MIIFLAITCALALLLRVLAAYISTTRTYSPSLCQHCGYPCRGLPPLAWRCPECGGRFIFSSFAGDTIQWRPLLRSRATRRGTELVALIAAVLALLQLAPAITPTRFLPALCTVCGNTRVLNELHARSLRSKICTGPLVRSLLIAGDLERPSFALWLITQQPLPLRDRDPLALFLLDHPRSSNPPEPIRARMIELLRKHHQLSDKNWQRYIDERFDCSAFIQSSPHGTNRLPLLVKVDWQCSHPGAASLLLGDARFDLLNGFTAMSVPVSWLADVPARIEYRYIGSGTDQFSFSRPLTILVLAEGPSATQRSAPEHQVQRLLRSLLTVYLLDTPSFAASPEGLRVRVSSTSGYKSVLRPTNRPSVSSPVLSHPSKNFDRAFELAARDTIPGAFNPASESPHATLVSVPADDLLELSYRVRCRSLDGVLHIESGRVAMSIPSDSQEIYQNWLADALSDAPLPLATEDLGPVAPGTANLYILAITRARGSEREQTLPGQFNLRFNHTDPAPHTRHR